MQIGKEFHYGEATSVSSIFPGGCVRRSAVALRAGACDITVLLLASRPPFHPRLEQATLGIRAVDVAFVFAPGGQTGLVQRAYADTFLHRPGHQRARGGQ